jgi:hypothetical protein
MGDIVNVRFSPTLSTSVYASGDILFNTTQLPGGFKIGKIVGITIVDKDDVGENCDLYFLDADSSMGTVNSPPSITDALAENIVGVMSNIAASKDLGGVRIASYEFELGFDVQAGVPLYIAAITNTALTHTVNGVLLTLRVEKA